MWYEAQNKAETVSHAMSGDENIQLQYNAPYMEIFEEKNTSTWKEIANSHGDSEI